MRPAFGTVDLTAPKAETSHGTYIASPLRWLCEGRVRRLFTLNQMLPSVPHSEVQPKEARLPKTSVIFQLTQKLERDQLPYIYSPRVLDFIGS